MIKHTEISSNKIYILATYLFAFFFISIFGNLGNTTLNQIILWGGGPILASIFILPNINRILEVPREYLLYFSLLLISVLSIPKLISVDDYWRYLQVILSNLIFMLIIFFGLKTWSDVKMIIIAIGLACVSVVVYSYFSELESLGEDSYRLEGLAGNANGTANFARVAILLILLLGLLYPSRNFLYRIAGLTIILFLTYSIILTASRGSFMNILFILFGYLHIRHIKGLRGLFIIVLLLVFGNTLMVYFDTALQDFYLYERLFKSGSIIETADEDSRVELYALAWKIFTQHPLTGIGLNQFHYYSFGKISHTDLLDIAVQLGIAGGLAYLLIYVRLFQRITRDYVKAKFNYEKLFHKMVLIIFISELIFGLTNPNWFSQIQMILLSLIITIYAKKQFMPLAKYIQIKAISS